MGIVNKLLFFVGVLLAVLLGPDNATALIVGVTASHHQPAYTCDSLKAENSSENHREYRFTTKATAKNDAQITGYGYDFGDGRFEGGVGPVIDHTFAHPGMYVATVTVSIDDGQNATPRTVSCKTTVTVPR